MFREMRRKHQQMEEPDCIRILTGGSSGVLAVNGDGGYPYTVPLNYIYLDGKIYIHCAKSGHKTDAITRDDKVSFCVVGMEQNAAEEFTTYFKSVVVFGRAVIVDNEAEMRYAIEKLTAKYAPNESDDRRNAEIEREWKMLAMLRIDVEHMTGKQAIELTAQRAEKR